MSTPVTPLTLFLSGPDCDLKRTYQDTDNFDRTWVSGEEVWDLLAEHDAKVRADERANALEDFIEKLRQEEHDQERQTREHVAKALRVYGYSFAAEIVLKTGCCSTCHGTGISKDIETNGRCWDCKGTGHAHEGDC